MRAALALTPNREIDFDCACVCVACVRAKLRARDDSSMARARRANLWDPSLRPSLRRPGGGPNSKFELYEF